MSTEWPIQAATTGSAYEKPKKPTKKRADERQTSLGFGDESE
jgi:hypothetical protein